MPTLTCSNRDIVGEQTEFACRVQAHLKRHGANVTDYDFEGFVMERFREGRFIDESVAAGVAH